jgi:hypothetical protein
MNVCLFEQLSLNHPSLLFKITSVINRIYLFQKAITSKLYTWMSWSVHCNEFPCIQDGHQVNTNRWCFFLYSNVLLLYYRYALHNDIHCILFFYLIRSLFYIKVSPFGKKFEATQKKLEFATGNSDHLTIINGYQVI